MGWSVAWARFWYVWGSVSWGWLRTMRLQWWRSIARGRLGWGRWPIACGFGWVVWLYQGLEVMVNYRSRKRGHLLGVPESGLWCGLNRGQRVYQRWSGCPAVEVLQGPIMVW